MELVLASNNRGKLGELTALLVPYRVTVYPLSRFTDHSPDETGATFAANALLKARYASALAKLPAIADDSGLEVDALGGAPGVYSARFAGEGASDVDNNRKLLAALQDIPDAARTARFRCVLAYVADEHTAPIVAEGIWEGHILRAPRGAHGFGYDPLFVPRGSDMSAAELDRDIKNTWSHRGQALRALLTALKASGAVHE